MKMKVKITAKKEYFDKINKIYTLSTVFNDITILLGDFDAEFIYRTYEVEEAIAGLFLQSLAWAVNNDLKIEFPKE